MPLISGQIPAMRHGRDAADGSFHNRTHPHVPARAPDPTGRHLLEVVDESPWGSMILLNRSGLLRRKILRLESELAAARAELAALEAAAGDVDGRGGR